MGIRRLCSGYGATRATRTLQRLATCCVVRAGRAIAGPERLTIAGDQHVCICDSLCVDCLCVNRELRRLGNRLASVLEYGSAFDDVMLAGRPHIHFRHELWRWALATSCAMWRRSG